MTEDKPMGVAPSSLARGFSSHAFSGSDESNFNNIAVEGP